MNSFVSVLWWFCGTDSHTMKACSSRDYAIRSALGLVFVLNYVLLVLAWIKVGMRYFGTLGILPGLLVPSVFLSLDRVLGMRHRHLTGVLAVYNIAQTDDKTELKLRIAMALALSLATTFTFQMHQASSLISEKTHSEWKAANSQIRDEISRQIDSEYKQNLESLKHREKLHSEQRAIIKEMLLDSTNRAKEAFKKASSAREQQSFEKGGLDGRVAGEARRFHAQREIANRNEALASQANADYENLKRELESIDTKLSDVSRERLKAETEKNSRLSGMDELIKQDGRFVLPKDGLFNDATIFVRLFTDPDVAPGMWLMSLLMWGVLMSLELSALIALSILPACAYDIALLANLRVEAAKLVAAAEIKLAQQRSRSPPIQVHERGGSQSQNQGRPINQGANCE